MRIVVVGGTRLIGSKLVTKLIEHGHEAVAASPSLGVNTITGEGLAEALDGTSVVVDVSQSPSFEYAAALEFFATSTRNLLAAEGAAGVGHHVALAVVGTERLSESGYFRAKIAQETLIKAAPIPYSIVHATQFFEFIRNIAAGCHRRQHHPPCPVLFQPIAAEDVAQAVARVAVGTPVNGIVEVAGPDQFTLDVLIRRFLGARDDPREVLTDPQARYFGAIWASVRLFRATAPSSARSVLLTGSASQRPRRTALAKLPRHNDRPPSPWSMVRGRNGVRLEASRGAPDAQDLSRGKALSADKLRSACPVWPRILLRSRPVCGGRCAWFGADPSRQCAINGHAEVF